MFFNDEDITPTEEVTLNEDNVGEDKSTNEDASDESKDAEKTDDSTDGSKSEDTTSTDKEDMKSDSSDKSSSSSSDKTESESKSEDMEDDEKVYNITELISELADADDSLQKSEDTIDKIEKAGEASTEDIETLKRESARQRESINTLEMQLKKVYQDKADLTLKNAELEAFGGNYSDPSLLIVVKNYDKAKSGDDRAKEKVLSICRDMIENLTGESASPKKDIISAAASYNKTKLNMPSSKSDDNETGFVL